MQSPPWDKINFEGFEFGDRANFSQCKWRGVNRDKALDDPKPFAPGRAFFAGATFGDEANFTDATFGYRASFAGAALGNVARFNGATFGAEAAFTGAAFGYNASFAGVAFRDKGSFAGAAFGHKASFAGAVFGALASFDGAAFWAMASFAGAVFGALASFAGAAFGHWASFDGAVFGYRPSFDGAVFGYRPSFGGAVFGDEASFAGAAFGDWAIFDNAHFEGRVEFTGMSEEQWAREVLSKLGPDAEARPALEKRHKDLREIAGSRLDRFLTISFSRARFDGVAVFSGRSFEKTANFARSRFYCPPDFERCGGIARIDFSGTHIGFARPGRLHWTTDSEVPLRLRAFRKVAEETKNHDLERDLYIEERKAERGFYWHQLVEELKKAPEELKKKLEDIKRQKKHVWLERRLQRRARNAPSKLPSFSRTSYGSSSWAPIGRWPIMDVVLCGPPSRSV